MHHYPIVVTAIINIKNNSKFKKPKAVFDPSDNYLPRSQRQSNVAQSLNGATAAVAVDANTGTGGNVEQRKREMESSLPPKRLSQSSVNSSVASSPSLQQVDTCSICNKKEMKRGIGAKNKLCACVECDIKGNGMPSL